MAKNKYATFFLLILVALFLWGCPSGSGSTWIPGDSSLQGDGNELSISGPVELTVVLTIDTNKWSGNPFTVTAFLQNNTNSTISGDSLTLDLSEASGLTLDADEVAIHDLDDIPSGEGVLTSWSVLAVTPGLWTYSVEDETGLTAESSITVPILCGDLDHDGDVDEDDYTIFESALGSHSGYPEFNEEADYDADGCITYDDYTEWDKCYEAYNTQ